MRLKPSYGLDAPEILKRYSGFVILTLIIGILLSIYLPHVEWAYILETMVFLTVFFFLFPIVSIIFGSIYFKFREREWLFEKLGLTGNENLLDVGCGRGLLLIGAAKRLTTGKAHGLDLWLNTDQTNNSIEAVKENARLENVENKIEIHTGDMRNMPFPDESFTTVISSWAIHNLPKKEDREKVLMEIKRILKPGGKIAIMDVNYVPHYINFFYTHGFTEVQLLGPRYTFGTKTYLLLGTK